MFSTDIIFKNINLQSVGDGESMGTDSGLFCLMPVAPCERSMTAVPSFQKDGAELLNGEVSLGKLLVTGSVSSRALLLMESPSYPPAHPKQLIF